MPKTDALSFKLRERRDVSAPSTTSGNGANQTAIALESSQPLLGVNGTGQRIDVSNANNTEAKASVVSDPLSADGTKKPPVLLNSATPPSAVEITTEAIVDVDLPEDDIQKILDNHKNFTVKQDYYDYYNTSTVVDVKRSESFWASVNNFSVSHLLSSSHRRAIVSSESSALWTKIFITNLLSPLSDGSPVVRLSVLRHHRPECDCRDRRLSLHRRIRALLARRDAVHRSADGQLRLEHLQFIRSEILGRRYEARQLISSDFGG